MRVIVITGGSRGIGAAIETARRGNGRHPDLSRQGRRPAAGPGQYRQLRGLPQNRYQVSVEVVDAGQPAHRTVLDTVNGYTFTPMATVKAAQRVLEGEARPGFQTPAGLFGEDFVLSIADTTIVDG